MPPSGKTPSQRSTPFDNGEQTLEVTVKVTRWRPRCFSREERLRTHTHHHTHAGQQILNIFREDGRCHVECHVPFRKPAKTHQKYAAGSSLRNINPTRKKGPTGNERTKDNDLAATATHTRPKFLPVEIKASDGVFFRSRTSTKNVNFHLQSRRTIKLKSLFLPNSRR